jgi:DDE superfamily endonuclease
MASDNGDSNPIGPNWVCRFLKRHPNLVAGRNQSLTKDRIVSAIPTLISTWFQHVIEVLARYHIKPENRHNMDEIGFQLGHHQKQNMVFDRRCGPPKSLNSGNTNWVLALECISATGQALTLFVIHRGIVPNQPFDQWFPPSKECPNFFWGFTKKGWTSNEYALRWLEKVFIPKTYC